MPNVSRLHLKTGLVYFCLGLVLSLCRVLQQAGLVGYPFHLWAPVMLHFLVVGWITQIIMGVSLWMFPRHRREKPRGYAVLSWLGFGGINTGLVFRAIAEPVMAHQALPWAGNLLILSALLQLVGGLAYVLNIWPRIKARPSD